MRKNRHWLLTMVMLLCSITGSAHDFEVDGIYYNILSSSEKTVEVTYEGDYPHLISYTPEYSGEVVIPASVTYNSTPYDVVSINEYTFSNCINLTSVSIPYSVTTIEEYIFEACNNLVTIIVDEDNKVFDSRDNCNAIISTVNNTIVQGCIGTVIPNSVTEIGKKAFASFYKGLTSVTIPENIVCVGEQAFAYCYELGTIDIAFGVEEIGEGAFYDCKGLLSISLPNSVTKIGKDAFYCCENLTSAVIPDNIQSIDEATFYGCRKMESISIGDGIMTIGASAFQDCAMLSTVVIPANVTEIATSAFIYCSNLSSIISLNSNAPSLGNMAFNGISSSAVLTIPSGSTSSYEDAGWTSYFSSVVEMEEDVLATSLALDATEASLAPNETLALTATLLPEDVTNPALSWISSDEAVATVDANGVVTAVAVGEATITASTTDGSELSASCKVSVKISGTCGENLTWVLDEATGVLTISGEGEMYGYGAQENQSPWFDYRSIIKEVVVEEGVTSIGGCAFYSFTAVEECTLTTVTLPESIETIGGAAFSGCTKLSSINFPSTLKEIPGEAFSYTTSLKELTLPEHLETIEQYAFHFCGATSLEIPSSVKTIESYPFGRGNNLTSIVVDDGNATYDSRNNCNAIIETATDKLILGCKSTIIPDGIKTIGEGAFSNSGSAGLESLTIPASVTLIEDSGLDCFSLTEVVCLSSTPPALGEYGPCVNSEGRVLYVPDNNAVAAYTEAGWNNYFSSIVAVEIIATSLALDVTEASLAPNETLTLTATLLPEDVTNSVLTWTSSNEAVATVDESGVVTAVADGEATITVSTTDGSELSATCKVTVKTIVLATSLALDVTEASLAPNETLTLTATLQPGEVTNPALTWTSSNEAVATVDANGVVTAVADGEATITVSTTDGSDLSASCKVTIKTNILAASLALDVTEASLAPNETLALSATLLPEDVTNPALTWTSSNEAVATVDESGVVTAVADGEATITVSTTDGSELSATCEVTVKTEVVVEYENKIYFEDVTVFSNSSVSHPLQLKNTVNMTAVQFDLYLPEGITLTTDTRGRYAITFNADRADNTTHTLSSALQSDGAIRVLCYSVDSYEFLGSEGAIFNFPLEISEMEDGDYDMVIKNIVLTDVSGTKYEIPSMTSTITVLNVAPGDCNGDKTIDVADIVVLANSILGNTADGFVEKAADYNADGAVDVADIVNIANYILNGNASNARNLMRAALYANDAVGYSFDILPFVLAAEESKTITLDLASTEATFTAFQCDLYLPEGVSVDKNTRGKYAFSFNEARTDASCHVLSSALQSDGAIRVLCYSQDTYNFLGTEGALLNIPLTADASLANGVYEFSIAQTVLTYVSGEKVSPESYKGSIVVGDGGKVEEVKLYGRYTSEVLNEYTTAFGTNDGITCLDLTEAIYLAEDGLLTTGNPNTIVYLAEGDALANESNVVSGEECANLVLTDGYAFSASVPFNASQASYERELAAGKYGTIVLPYAPNTDDYVFYALTSATDNMLTFDEVTNPVANTPYLYKLRDGESATQITNSEVAVSSELTSVGTSVWQMVGSFTNQTIVAGEDEENSYYVYTSSDNQVHQVTNTLTVKPYRAYFTTSSANNMQLAVRTRGGEETLIDASEVDGLCPEVYYDLSGRRVDNPTKGVYIVNGKKVVL